MEEEVYSHYKTIDSVESILIIKTIDKRQYFTILGV